MGDERNAFAFKGRSQFVVSDEAVDPEFHAGVGATRRAVKQAGSWKSGSARECSSAQKLLIPPTSSSTQVMAAEQSPAGSAPAGIAASNIAKLLPCRMVHSGSRGEDLSFMPSLGEEKS